MNGPALSPPPSPFPSFPVPPDYGPNGSEPEPDLTDPTETAEPPEPAAPVDPLAAMLAAIDDTTLLQIVNEGKHRALQARQQRHMQNRRNWRAVHGIFEFLTRKQAGQSRIVIPALETSLEQVCAELTSQLVGYDEWFKAEFVDEAPIPELTVEDATRALRHELDRLAIEGNYLESTYGIHRLIFDALKVGLIESVATLKVSIHEDATTVYGLNDADPAGPPLMTSQVKRRLKVEIVPFDDHYPDPSPARAFDIHEVEVPIADLPAMGFTEDQISLMRGNLSSEKEEQRRVRAGSATGVTGVRNRVVLREYWGKLIHPSTGELLYPDEVMFVQCGTALIVKKPVPITSILWHGKRPFISHALLPTPLSHVHHAFLDIAIPLVETESELYNLIIDGGFAETLGIKWVKSYMLNNPEVVSKGLIAGITLDILEGFSNEEAVGKVDTGIITDRALAVLDRSTRAREEAFRINALQLGQFAPRKSSATEVTQVAESSHDLFSAMGDRWETGLDNPFVELCWLTHWQFADDFSMFRPEHRTIFENMSPQERFVLMANGVKFKAVGYKQLQGAAKDWQKLITYENMIQTNPTYQQVDAQENDPLKKIDFAYRALGIDPLKFRRDADSPPPPPPPQMMPPQQPGQPGQPPMPGQNPNPAMMPNLAQATEMANPPNALGVRGIQAP